MDPLSEIAPVLAEYPAECQPTRAEFLDSAGGFSGARLWRLTTPHGELCLRRWPAAYPPVERLQFIQAVLWHVDLEGFNLVGVPLEAASHAGYVEHEGALWQLEPWLPGRADFRQAPSDARLQAALVALAQFHRAAASFPLPDIGPSPSPGMAQRRERLAVLRGGRLAEISAAIRPGDWPALAERAGRLVQLFTLCADRVAGALEGAASIRVRIQPCIRDIWHDHVLFVDAQVSGLIDFGGLRADNVATDVARLVGSLIDDDARSWRVALAAYESVRPLSLDERQLVTVFDRTTVLMGGLEWLEWIYLERKAFPDRKVVEDRLDQIIRRLAHLAADR